MKFNEVISGLLNESRFPEFNFSADEKLISQLSDCSPVGLSITATIDKFKQYSFWRKGIGKYELRDEMQDEINKLYREYGEKNEELNFLDDAREFQEDVIWEYIKNWDACELIFAAGKKLR